MTSVGVRMCECVCECSVFCVLCSRARTARGHLVNIDESHAGLVSAVGRGGAGRGKGETRLSDPKPDATPLRSSTRVGERRGGKGAGAGEGAKREARTRMRVCDEECRETGDGRRETRDSPAMSVSGGRQWRRA